MTVCTWLDCGKCYLHSSCPGVDMVLSGLVSFLYWTPSLVVTMWLLGSLHSLVMVVGYYLLVIRSWCMTSRFIWKSCDGKCSFLYLVLKSSQSKPSCFLVAFDMGSSDLAICLTIFALVTASYLTRGYCVYHETFKQALSFLLSFIKQVLYNLNIFLCKPIWLWVMRWACDMIYTALPHQVLEHFCCVAWPIIWY